MGNYEENKRLYYIGMKDCIHYEGYEIRQIECNCEVPKYRAFMKCPFKGEIAAIHCRMSCPHYITEKQEEEK